MDFSCPCWFSQLAQGNSGNMSALQQIQARTPLITVIAWTWPFTYIFATQISCSFQVFPFYHALPVNMLNFQDIKSEINLGPTQKSLPMDPSSIYGQAILQSTSGLGGAGNFKKRFSYKTFVLVIASTIHVCIHVFFFCQLSFISSYCKLLGHGGVNLRPIWLEIEDASQHA